MSKLLVVKQATLLIFKYWADKTIHFQVLACQILVVLACFLCLLIFCCNQSNFKTVDAKLDHPGQSLSLQGLLVQPNLEYSIF